MARVPLSGSASPRLSPGGVRLPSVGHMPFFLILVVALLFGLTPTAGAVVAGLGTSDEGTRLVVEEGGAVGINNNVSISSTPDGPSILVEAVAPEGMFRTAATTVLRRPLLVSDAPPQAFGSSTSHWATATTSSRSRAWSIPRACPRSRLS